LNGEGTCLEAIDEIDAMLLGQIMDAFRTRDSGLQLARHQGLIRIIDKNIPKAS
jgi:hypothetical protein